MLKTFEEYDDLLEKFNMINSPVRWPSVKEMDLMETDPDRWLPLACYFYEKSKPPKNKEEEYSKKTLRNFIDKNLFLFSELKEVELCKPANCEVYISSFDKYVYSNCSSGKILLPTEDEIEIDVVPTEGYTVSAAAVKSLTDESINRPFELGSDISGILKEVDNPCVVLDVCQESYQWSFKDI